MLKKLNISHSVYPTNLYTFNGYMQFIHNRVKTETILDKDISCPRPTGFFQVTSCVGTMNTIKNYLKK